MVAKMSIQSEVNVMLELGDTLKLPSSLAKGNVFVLGGEKYILGDPIGTGNFSLYKAKSVDSSGEIILKVPVQGLYPDADPFL